jgi:C-terminal processing protease CtpA/Prc
VGYVRLATFNSNTTAAAQEAFYDLQKQGVAGLVLDIRNNGGGLFPAGKPACNRWQHARSMIRVLDCVAASPCQGCELQHVRHNPSRPSRSPAVVQQSGCAVRLLWCAGVNVARMLVDQGDLVLIADNQGVRDIYSADGNSIDKSTPLVVLVNKGTASASEVSSQALLDVLWNVDSWSG